MFNVFKLIKVKLKKLSGFMFVLMVKLLIIKLVEVFIRVIVLFKMVVYDKGNKSLDGECVGFFFIVLISDVIIVVLLVNDDKKVVDKFSLVIEFVRLFFERD